MEAQERAYLSKQFIETLLRVPVTLGGAGEEQIKSAVKQLIPGFLKDNFPFFITPAMSESFEFHAIYHIMDFIGLNFNLFLYEGEGCEREGCDGEGAAPRQILIAGPYLGQQPDMEFCEEILQKNGKNMALLVPFYNYCLGLPVVSNSAMMEAMQTAVRAVTGEEGEVLYRHYQPQATDRPPVVETGTPAGEAAMMELLEERYRYENLMLQEVGQGNAEQALKYYRQFSFSSRSIVRTEDPIRTCKNLGFSLNTMLRKSAEQAGIHPIYLDIISTNFAMLIENSRRMEEIEDIRAHMIGAYCRFVQKQRLDQYPPLVRLAITYIRVHLAEPLTLKQVAEGIRVSPSYLSRIFNQEVKESLSNYITRARIEKASQLLTFTAMSIQNTAFYVGFSNLNYFSRCFKKYCGMTPTEYRNSLRTVSDHTV